MHYVRRKINFYVPGMITLFFLPFLLFEKYDLQIQELWKSNKVIKLTVADKSWLKKFPQAFKPFGNKLIPDRNYIKIFLTGSRSDDSCKLAFAKIRIEEISVAHDTINGIQFHFGEKTEYWEFVKAVDNLMQAGAKRYAPIDDDIWFYYIYEDTTLIRQIKPIYL